MQAASRVPEDVRRSERTSMSVQRFERVSFVSYFYLRPLFSYSRVRFYQYGRVVTYVASVKEAQ